MNSQPSSVSTRSMVAVGGGAPPTIIRIRPYPAAVLVSRAAIEMGALEALEGVPVRLFTYDFGASALLVVREALARRRAR